jgi:hypothetical protein
VLIRRRCATIATTPVAPRRTATSRSSLVTIRALPQSRAADWRS